MNISEKILKNKMWEDLSRGEKKMFKLSLFK